MSENPFQVEASFESSVHCWITAGAVKISEAVDSRMIGRNKEKDNKAGERSLWEKEILRKCKMKKQGPRHGKNKYCLLIWGKEIVVIIA